MKLNVDVYLRITKPRTQLHPALSISTQLHPALCNTLNVIRTKMLHVIEQFPPNLGRKIQSCLFWLKIGTHGILEVLIPKPGLNFWNSDPKINFWANLGRKSKKCSFYLKISTHGIPRMLIFIPTLFSKFPTLNPFLGEFGPKNSKLSSLPKHLHISRGYRFLFRYYFSEFPILILFFGKIWAEQFKAFRFSWQCTHRVSRGRWFLLRH